MLTFWKQVWNLTKKIKIKKNRNEDLDSNGHFYLFICSKDYLSIWYGRDEYAWNFERDGLCNEITIVWICKENKTHESECCCSANDGFKRGGSIEESLWERAEDYAVFNNIWVKSFGILALFIVIWYVGMCFIWPPCILSQY